MNLRAWPGKSWENEKKMEQKLIRIVRENPTISKINLAGELGIGRSTLYRLLIKLEHKVHSTGGTRRVEWTVLED